MKPPTPMVDAVAFTINRDEVVHIYPANEVVSAQFARGLEAGLAEALRQIEELRAQKREIMACIELLQRMRPSK